MQVHNLYLPAEDVIVHKRQDSTRNTTSMVLQQPAGKIYSWFNKLDTTLFYSLESFIGACLA